MNLSRLFVLRPVATLLLSLAMLLAGAVAYFFLPVAALPQLDIPTVFVRASLAGASPATMAATVATPLERAMGQIAGITELTSSSSQGQTHVIMQFDLDRDVDGAAREVMAAINAARSLLPSAMKTLPTYRKANPSDAPILMLALTSDTLGPGELYDLASSRLQQKIAQVKGVGQVTVFGGALPAVRIDIDAKLLAAKNISLSSVRDAVEAATVNTPSGTLDDGGRLTWIAVNGQMTEAREYRDLVIAHQDGAAVRLGDVAHVYDSVEDAYSAGYFNNEASVSISVTRQAGANMIETVNAIKRQLPILNEMLPSGTKITLAIDQSLSVRQTLADTEESLIIAVLLVIVVVFLFLRRGRAVIIPALALPISIIATFGVMYLLGFSLNALSMMALIISTGFVVDDAIVVLENIDRHIEEGMAPMQAALEGSRQIGFTVLSMTLSLIAAFIPLFLMEGIVGRLFKEFAVTLSAALLVSMVVSLTLTPMLSARLLKPKPRVGDAPDRSREFWLLRVFARGYCALHRRYMASLGAVIRHPKATLAMLAAVIAANFYLYGVIDKGLFPNQDNGMIMGMARSDLSTSFDTMNERLQAISGNLLKDPAVRYVLASTGGDGPGSRNTGRFFIRLQDFDDRDATAAEIANRLTRAAADVPGTQLFLMAAQDLRVGGRSANASYQYTLLSDSLDDLNTWAPKVYAVMKGLPELTSVDSDSESGGPEVRIVIDRDAASRYGLDASDIDAYLSNAFSQRQIATQYRMLNQYYCILGLDPAMKEHPGFLDEVDLINDQGERVPLNVVAHFEQSTAPLSVAHQSQMAATTIAFNLADGVSLERAREAIDAAVASIGMPDTMHASLQGTAKTFETLLKQIPWLILAAIMTIYILLGILYESWIHPVTILSTLPSAGIGALILMMISGTELTVIALIGILLLIGIVKKNAILMIDFAIEAEKLRGLSPEAAALEACDKRFRPILMTTLCAFFGALPLVIQSGSTAALNRPLGIAICGGLAFSQVLTLYTTPVVYVTLDRLAGRCRRGLARIKACLAAQ